MMNGWLYADRSLIEQYVNASTMYAWRCKMVKLSSSLQCSIAASHATECFFSASSTIVIQIVKKKAL